ncbi:MAG TPA: TIGR02679 family protein [Acidimicrobiales bacterium]|nr:TIGR02679 family protein [Acidimicrobiales bacterium]
MTAAASGSDDGDGHGDTVRSALRRPPLRPLVDELARRLTEGTPVTVAIPPACATAVADLLGLDRVPAGGRRLPVVRLLDVLGLADVDALRREVEAVSGPLPDAAGERRAGRRRREDLWAWLEAAAATVPLGSLDVWVATQRLRGVRGGVERRRRELGQALAVLGRLPADGVALANLANDLAGTPHGLDHGRSLATVVLEAVAVATGRSRPSTAEDARALWESVGVAPDPLSSTVTVLGLPGGAGPLGAWLQATHRVSEPVTLTLANLRRWPVPPLPADGVAVVVENPSVLADAATAGWNGPPLVCSSGRPSVAVVVLLRQLGAAGARLHQHADFDPAGVGITAWLQERAGTLPWRMTADDYLTARPDREPSFDTVPPTPWDPALRAAMAGRRIAVYEEDVRHRLLHDAQRLR